LPEQSTPMVRLSKSISLKVAGRPHCEETVEIDQPQGCGGNRGNRAETGRKPGGNRVSLNLHLFDPLKKSQSAPSPFYAFSESFADRLTGACACMAASFLQHASRDTAALPCRSPPDLSPPPGCLHPALVG
jgi:hypothetical protein